MKIESLKIEKNKGLGRSCFAALLTVAYLTGILGQANLVQAQSNKESAGVVNKAFLDVALYRYSNMQAALNNGGTDAFLKEIGQQKLSGEDKLFMHQYFKMGTKLPELKYQSGNLVGKIGDKTLTLEVVNAAQGEFKLNGIAFKYDPSQSLAKQILSLSPLLSKSEKLSFLNFLFPQAQAFTTTEILIGVGILLVVAFGTYFLAKNNAKKEAAIETDKKLAAQKAELTAYVDEKVQSSTSHDTSTDSSTDIEVVN